nr:ABC transporter ATP-binding protein [Pseudomonas sp.]
MSLLRVEGLHKSFGGVHAVQDISFRLEAGHMLALIGPNGAGKSTCFNLVNGQLRPDAGKVFINDTDVTGMPPRRIWRQGVGRTFQVPAVFGSMTVLENLQVALASHARRSFGLWRPQGERFRDEAMALLERVGMQSQAERLCGVLAYGDVKRVELAIALAGAPRVLLMDEPTAGMSRDERHALMNLTRQLTTQGHLGVLFTEHSLDVVFAHADHIVVMARGQMVASGKPDAIQANADVQAVYLGKPIAQEASV